MLFTLETERESSVKGFTELIVNSVRGFCMALADSVPGVSGGTVAFLLGFYDRFIGSLDDLFHGARAARMHQLIENFDEAASHPDDDDLARLREAVQAAS